MTKTIILVLSILLLIMNGCSDNENKKIIELQNQIVEKDKKIFELQEKLGNLRETKGKGEAHCWDIYKYYIIPGVIFLPLLFVLLYSREKKKCQEKNDMLKSKLEEVTINHKKKVSELEADLNSIKKQMQDGQKNEVVNLIKNIRETRGYRIRKIDPGYNKN